MLRPRNDVVLSQRHASKTRSENVVERPKPTTRRESFGQPQVSRPAPVQQPVTRRRSVLQQETQNITNRRDSIQSSLPPVPRRMSMTQKEPEPVAAPSVPRRRRSLLGTLPPLSVVMKVRKENDIENNGRGDVAKVKEVTKTEAPILSRRYATRSTTNK